MPAEQPVGVSFTAPWPDRHTRRPELPSDRRTVDAEVLAGARQRVSRTVVGGNVRNLVVGELAHGRASRHASPLKVEEHGGSVDAEPIHQLSNGTAGLVGIDQLLHPIGRETDLALPRSSWSLLVMRTT